MFYPPDCDSRDSIRSIVYQKFNFRNTVCLKRAPGGSRSFVFVKIDGTTVPERKHGKHVLFRLAAGWFGGRKCVQVDTSCERVNMCQSKVPQRGDSDSKKSMDESRARRLSIRPHLFVLCAAFSQCRPMGFYC